MCGLERESCVRHVSYCYPLDIYALNRIDWRNSARMTEKPIKVIRNDSKKNCLSSIQREIPNNLRCSSHVCLYNIFWTKCRFFILCGGIFSHELSNLAFFECPMIFFLVLNFPGYIYSQISWVVFDEKCTIWWIWLILTSNALNKASDSLFPMSAKCQLQLVSRIV